VEKTVEKDKVEQIRQRLLKSEIVYPEKSSSAGSQHYRYTPVFATLHSYMGSNDVPPVEDCAEYLLDRYQMDALRNGSPGEVDSVLHRTHKLVLEFYQRLHLLALLTDTFGPYIAFETLEDKGFNVDFILQINPSTPGLQYVKKTELGICTIMFSDRQWKVSGADWVSRKMRSKQELDYPAWPGPVFSISNERIPPVETINGLPLYGPCHADNLLSEIQEHFAPHQYTLLEG
jgi:hypothetical protein